MVGFTPLANAHLPQEATRATPEQRLWQTVLLHAARDLVAADTKRDAALHRRRVASWIMTPDFAEVCECAGTPVTTTRRRFRELLRAGHAVRARARKVIKNHGTPHG